MRSEVGFKFCNVIYLTDTVRDTVPFSVGSKEKAISKGISGSMGFNGTSKAKIVKMTIPKP